MTKLIKSNIYKDRGILIAFLLIIMLATTLLHTGLFLNSYESNYDKIYREYGYTDGGFVFTFGDNEAIDKLVGGISDIQDYKLIDTITPQLFTYTTSKSDKEKKLEGDLFFSFDTYKLSDKIQYIEKDDSITGPKIYITVYTAYNSNVRVGDKMYLRSDLFGDYDLTVAGIYQDNAAGNPYSYHSFILDDESYDKLKEKSDEVALEGKEYAGQTLIAATFKDGVDHGDGVSDLCESLRVEGYQTFGYSSELGKEGYLAIVNIVSGFLTVFSVVVMSICFIMIIFTVNNNIDRDITNIGALRAVGHTKAQIRAALTGEYLVLGFIGTAIGITVSYLIMPVFEESVIRSLSGLVWDKRFYPEYTFGVLLLILMVIIIVTSVSSEKIRNLHPATALRFGLKANTFKKNHLPLDNTKGSLNILLALKNSLQSMGQNILVFGVVMVVGFLAMFSAILYYNTTVDITKFQRLMQGDAPDAYVMIDAEDEDEMYDIIEQIQEHEDVYQAYGLSTATGSVAGNDTTVLNVSKPEFVYCGLYEGEMIQEDNEAVIGKVTADKAGVDIGDEIEVEFNGTKARFLVTGFQQAVYGMGERVYITDGGAKRLGMDVDHTYIRVRITDPSTEKVDRVLNEIKDKLGDKCVDIQNYYQETRSNENVPIFAVRTLVAILVFINILTVLVVIRLLLKTVFIRREKEFGIKKAVGFTSKQLRIQLSLSLIPTTVIAALVGAVMGHFLTNPLFSLIFKGFGIMKADLIMKSGLIIVASVAVSLIVFIFSYIMSGRMKKVSAYKLIQE